MQTNHMKFAQSHSLGEFPSMPRVSHVEMKEKIREWEERKGLRRRRHPWRDLGPREPAPGKEGA